MRPAPSFLLAACLVAACGSNGTGTGPGAGGGPTTTATTVTTCYDAMSKPTSSCALTPTGDICAMGDANACTPLTQVDVYADDGKNGVCLHLVFTNECQGEIFADTCIQHQDPPATMPTQQCWTSSVLPGGTIDVSQCHATGSYFSVATASSGQIDILEQKCPAPSP